MDQQAFRQIISTPRLGSGSAPTNRAFGLTNKRSRLTAAAASSSSSTGGTTPSDLRPRKVDPEKAKHPFKPRVNPVTGEAYVDRATARRQGAETEFADVEKLLAQFEARAAQLETDEERQALREQFKYLGGDEKHTVLVKGLDFALLAQNKARLEAEGVQTGDQDLEKAFESGKNVDPNILAQKESEGSNEQGSKRSRETIIESLKKRRIGQSTSSSSSSAAALSTKFKPIGFRPIGAGSSASSTTTTDDPDVKYLNGKRMRKKKKKDDSSQPPAAETSSGSKVMPPPPSPMDLPSSNMVNSNAARAVRAVPSDAASAALPSAAANTEPEASTATAATTKRDAPSPVRTVKALETSTDKYPLSPSKDATSSESLVEAQHTAKHDVEDDDDDDVDIFADAGGWTGLPDNDNDSDDDDDAAKPSIPVSVPTLPPSTTPGQKRDWFSTSTATTTTDTPDDTTPSSSSLPHPLSIARPHHSPTSPTSSTPSSETEEEKRPKRLEGFSDSTLSSDLTRALLQREVERDEKRKLREEGWKKKRKLKTKKLVDGQEQEEEQQQQQQQQGRKKRQE